MIRPGLAVGLLAAGLAACASYVPAPPHPERFADALAARRLDEKPAGAVWSGGDLLAAALARNPQVAEARARYQVALAAARTAKLAPGPTLTLTAEYADEKPRWGYGAAADLPLDFGVRRTTRFATADLQVLQAFYGYGDAVWTVRTAIEKARIALTAAETEVALADQAATLRRQRAERLDQRVAAGEDARTLSLAARTEAVAAERRLSEARGRRAQAQIDLAKALGVDAQAVRGLAVAPLGDPPDLTDLPIWRRDAALSRSDVLKAIADYDLSEVALRLEVAKQYPEIRLTPGYFYDHGVNKLPFNLSLVLPSYDLNRRAIDQAELTRAAAGRSLEAVQAAALSAVDTATVALATARVNRDRVAARDLPNARRAAADTAAALRAGSADRPEALAAQAAELDAEMALLDAQSAVQTAAADLEDALRRAFDPAQTAVLGAVLTRAGDHP